MAYNLFTLDKIKQQFHLSINETTSLFTQAPEVEPGQHLLTSLKDNVPLALAVNTEKVRSELIIAPILVEVRKILSQQISLFSGIKFDVDVAQGLTGTCDFMISASPEQLFLSAPLIIIVEAKNENINQGLGQCVATMLAARLFNEQKGNNIKTIYGTVTTGSAWKFLKLEAEVVYIDLEEYYINQISQIIGILLSMIQSVGLTYPIPITQGVSK